MRWYTVFWCKWEICIGGEVESMLAVNFFRKSSGHGSSPKPQTLIGGVTWWLGMVHLVVVGQNERQSSSYTSVPASTDSLFLEDDEKHLAKLQIGRTATSKSTCDDQYTTRAPKHSSTTLHHHEIHKNNKNTQKRSRSQVSQQAINTSSSQCHEQRPVRPRQSQINSSPKVCRDWDGTVKSVRSNAEMTMASNVMLLLNRMFGTWW